MGPLASPPDVASFNHQVWDVVRAIPAGRVASYGQVAKLVPLPAGVDPDSISRVWGALGRLGDGRMSQRRAMAAGPELKGRDQPRAGADKQRRLLEAEGVTFDCEGPGRPETLRVGRPRDAAGTAAAALDTPPRIAQ